MDLRVAYGSVDRRNEGVREKGEGVRNRLRKSVKEVYRETIRRRWGNRQERDPGRRKGSERGAF